MSVSLILNVLKFTLFCRAPSYSTIPAEPVQTILHHLPLKDLSLSHSNHLNRLDVYKEYRDRYFRLIHPYMADCAKFSNVMRKTDSFISSTTAYFFAHPYTDEDILKTPRHSLDIFTTRDNLLAVMDNLCTVQGFTFCKGPYSNYPENPNPHGTNTGSADGVLSTNTLTRNGLHVTVFSTTSRDTALLPVFHQSTTASMNIPTPNTFILFYPYLTLNNKGLIHHLAYDFLYLLQGLHFIDPNTALKIDT